MVLSSLCLCLLAVLSVGVALIPIPTLACPTIANAGVGTSLSATFEATGGTPSYLYTVSSGTLPPGLALSPSGALSGIPTVSGSYPFCVTATDALAVSSVPACCVVPVCPNCNDQDSCTQDSCSLGICTSAAVVCGVGQRCDRGACVCDTQSLCPGCCSGTTCVTTLTFDSCGLGGTPCMGCDDRNVCTLDSCSAGSCSYLPPSNSFAGPDQDVGCATSATMAANTPVVGTGRWTITGTGTIVDVNKPTTKVTELNGLVSLDWQISLGGCSQPTSRVNIKQYAAVSRAVVGNSSISIGCQSTATLSATAPVNGVGTWSGGTGSTVIVSPKSATTLVRNIQAESTIFTWSVSAPSCTASNATVTVEQVSLVSATCTGACQLQPLGGSAFISTCDPSAAMAVSDTSAPVIITIPLTVQSLTLEPSTTTTVQPAVLLNISGPLLLGSATKLLIVGRLVADEIPQSNGATLNITGGTVDVRGVITAQSGFVLHVSSDGKLTCGGISMLPGSLVTMSKISTSAVNGNVSLVGSDFVVERGSTLRVTGDFVSVGGRLSVRNSTLVVTGAITLDGTSRVEVEQGSGPAITSASIRFAGALAIVLRPIQGPRSARARADTTQTVQVASYSSGSGQFAAITASAADPCDTVTATQPTYGASSLSVVVTVSPSASCGNGGGGGLSAGAIAGIAIGGVAVAVCALLLVLFLVRRRQEKAAIRQIAEREAEHAAHDMERIAINPYANSK